MSMRALAARTGNGIQEELFDRIDDMLAKL